MLVKLLSVGIYEQFPFILVALVFPTNLYAVPHTWTQGKYMHYCQKMIQGTVS